MPAQEASDTASKIHPGIWGLLGAMAISTGRMGVAFIKKQGRPKEHSMSEKLDTLLEQVQTVKLNMATREDINIVQKRITDHIEAHAEGRFDRGAA